MHLIHPNILVLQPCEALALTREGVFSPASTSTHSLLSNAKELSVLLSSQKSNNGVRSHSEVVGWETSPEASDSFLGHGFRDAVHNAGVGELTIRSSLLLLHLSLDVVKGKGTDGSSNSGDHRATELNLEWGSIWAHGGGSHVSSSLV